MTQLTLELTRLTPQERKVLDMLAAARGAWVDGRDFLREYLPCYSQRITALRRKGYDIESTGKGGVAAYRLEAA